MANISSNNLTSLYGGGSNTVFTTTVVPNVAGTIPSRNLTTLYSGSGAPVTATTPYGNANVERFLDIGTDGGNSVLNIIATGNITGANANLGNLVVANFFSGDGGLLSNINGGNVGNVANANYANFAGNVVLGNQPNITAVGNLIKLDVIDSNTSYSPVVDMKFRTNNFPTVGRTGITFDIYANEANGEFARTETYIKHRGTPGSPTSAGVGDFVQRSVSSIFDGANTSRIAQFQTIVSNITPVVVENGWIGGQYNFNTGNPYGNGSNLTNSSSGFNTFSMNEIGSLVFSQGNRPDTGNTAQYTSTSYGRSSANPNIAAGMNFLRADGNREANLSVQAGYELYRIGAVPYNGTAFSAGGANGFSIAAITGNAYVANNANVPIDFRIRVVDSNNFASNSWFYNDGTVFLANSATVNGNLTVTGNSNLGSNSNVFISGGSASFVLTTDGAGNLSWSNIGNGSVANSNFANFAGNVTNSAQPNITSLGTLTSLSVSGNITSGNANLGNLAIANFFSGNGSLLTGIIASSGNANFANFAGNVTVNAQPNITSLGTLTSLSVSGNITSGNANLGNLAIANFFSGDGGLLSNIIATSGNANYANFAGNVTNSAQPNITSVGTLTSLSVSGNITSGNANLGNLVIANFFSGNGSLLTGIISTGGNSNYANFAGNLINGTSNISIPVANGNILISTAGNANIVEVGALGTVTLNPPAQGPLNALRINTYGRSGNVGAQRISSFRFRGNATTPLSVQPGDATMEFLTVGSNGTAAQTNSIARIQTIVDSSYTANGANIPIGWQVQVNDTNGGVNNQTKTHNFYANGATVLTGNLSAVGNSVTINKTTGGATTLNLTGDKTTSSQFGINESQFSVTMSNVDTTTGFSPFRFQQYAPNNNRFGSMFYYRARGTDFFTSAPVVANDKIMEYNFIVNSNNVTTSVGTFASTVTYNDNAGNVGTSLDFGATGTGTTGYLNGVINLFANTTTANNITANNVTINNSVNGFMKLSSYTAANLTAITGSVGWMAAVSDSSGGGNPNGMIAFWDTTNARWSYIHDNSAV